MGVLIDYWNGAAVRRCTAEAVGADQQRLRHEERARLIAQMRQRSGRFAWQLTRLRLVGGKTRVEGGRAVDGSIPPVWFDGDDLVLDETAQHGEPSIDRQGPGSDGRYCPMGFNWTWQAADPADCDRIAGSLPAFGEHHEYVMATHHPLRMPRLAVTTLDEVTDGQAALTATLWVDGRPVGTVEYGLGRPAVFRPADDRFGHEDLDEFVRACRWRGREVDRRQHLARRRLRRPPAAHRAGRHPHRDGNRPCARLHGHRARRGGRPPRPAHRSVRTRLSPSTPPTSGPEPIPGSGPLSHAERRAPSDVESDLPKPWRGSLDLLGRRLDGSRRPRPSPARQAGDLVTADTASIVVHAVQVPADDDLWPRPRLIDGVRVFTFDDSRRAYDQTQVRDDIHDGDVLYLPAEQVAGFLQQAWPFAVSSNTGACTH